MTYEGMIDDEVEARKLRRHDLSFFYLLGRIGRVETLLKTSCVCMYVRFKR